ncbi:hypothetical protein EDC01DRAFT_681013 [Geopyxis carbonaria]|nr:hypothetical protein EDC01DRAFT_681013 [Geopyxis carbonaria]
MFGNWGVIPLPSLNGAEGQKVFSNIKQHSGPLPFPVYHASTKPSDPTFPHPATEASFYHWFQKIRRVTDVTREHLDALNLSVEHDVPVDQLVPASFIPADDDAVFAERTRELMLDNATASETIARIRRDIKLGHMFKFYQTVEMMAPYYDLSEPAPAEAAMDVDAAAPDSPSNNDNGKRPASPSLSPDPGTPKKPHTDADAPADDADADVPAKPEEKFSVPDRFREDMIRNFIEPLCWAYGVRVYPPRVAPKVALQTSRFNVHMTTHIHLTAPLPADARAGIVEGPVLGLQVRHEHAFRVVADPAAALKKRRKKLLTLGMAPPKPSAPPPKPSRRSSSKSNPPAPAAPAGELLEPDTDADLAADGILNAAGEDIIGLTREAVALLSLAQHRARPHGSVEKKVRAHAIGRVPGEDDEWDTVFLVTGMHHHVSISEMRVSRGYLRWLRTGKCRGGKAKGQPRGGEGGWHELRLRKTRYWSLLVPEERREAARAVMGVMGWLTREGARREAEAPAVAVAPVVKTGEAEAKAAEVPVLKA